MGRHEQRSGFYRTLCALASCLPLASQAQIPPAEPNVLAPATAAPEPAKDMLVVPSETAQDAQAASNVPLDESTLLKQQLAQELPSFAVRVGLTAAEAEQLIDLFVERRIIERRDGLWPRSYFIGVALGRDLELRQKKIEKLLGKRIAAYRDYIETLPVRRRVLEFNAELAAEDALSELEQETLIEVLSDVERGQPPRRSDWLAVVPAEEDQAELAAKRFNIERKQHDFERLRELTRVQLQQVETLLSPRQFDVFNRIQSARLAAEQTHLENLRTAAGWTMRPLNR